MTDKEKIRKEVQRLMNELIQEKEKGYGSDTDDACILELQNVLTFIDSLQEEPVSENLEEAVDEYAPDFSNSIASKAAVDAVRDAFKTGAKWKKEHLWKPANDDDLPNIDREVIVLYQPYPCEGNEYAVSFAHRPPERWYGRNLDGEEHVFEPKTYDKGGWNIPDVKWWLDIELPKEE